MTTTRTRDGSAHEPHGAWPDISVVVPVRNDAADLPNAVQAILDQGYPGTLEVVLAVGPSTDGTEQLVSEMAERDPRIRSVTNPTGTTPAALNRAIAASNGRIIARIDARSIPTAGYLQRAVELIQETGAANVGGVQSAQGTTAFQEAVAAAMSSRFGTGDAKFHYGGTPGPTDTVYLGVFRREALDAIGGFDEDLVRNQDYELNIRLRNAGETIWFDPDLRIIYRPRATLPRLAEQYFQYGRWKREVIRRHPGSLRWRQAVPPVAVIANLVGAVLGLLGWRRGWLIPFGYLAAAFAASVIAGRGHDPSVRYRLPIVFAVMHHAWGLGFLLGIGRQSRSRHSEMTLSASRPRRR